MLARQSGSEDDLGTTDSDLYERLLPINTTKCSCGRSMVRLQGAKRANYIHVSVSFNYGKCIHLKKLKHNPLIRFLVYDIDLGEIQQYPCAKQRPNTFVH